MALLFWNHLFDILLGIFSYLFIYLNKNIRKNAESFSGKTQIYGKDRQQQSTKKFESSGGWRHGCWASSRDTRNIAWSAVFTDRQIIAFRKNSTQEDPEWHPDESNPHDPIETRWVTVQYYTLIYLIYVIYRLWCQTKPAYESKGVCVLARLFSWDNVGNIGINLVSKYWPEPFRFVHK